VVIETNVWLSAMFTVSGPPAESVRRVTKLGLPVFSPATFAELHARLWLPKFDRYLPMESRKRLLHDIDAIALWIDVPAAIVRESFCRDSNDDRFIHAALAADAPWLVTGDKDLLVLAQSLTARKLKVISPAVALSLISF
jgi:uncharacterized protein